MAFDVTLPTSICPRNHGIKMNKTIFGLIGSLLVLAPVQAAEVSDGAGLRLSLDKGKIASVELDGERLRPGGVGGFYLREPNSAKRVPMVGNAVSKDGKLQLTLTSPLQAKVSAVLTEGEGFIEVAGELENLTSTRSRLVAGLQSAG